MGVWRLHKTNSQIECRQTNCHAHQKGATRIAADIMGFDFTGIEIDKDYYEAALDRFNRHKQQLVMEF